jgi:hypothetical protein
MLVRRQLARQRVFARRRIFHQLPRQRCLPQPEQRRLERAEPAAVAARCEPLGQGQQKLHEDLPQRVQLARRCRRGDTRFLGRDELVEDLGIVVVLKDEPQPVAVEGELVPFACTRPNEADSSWIAAACGHVEYPVAGSANTITEIDLFKIDRRKGLVQQANFPNHLL